MYFICYNSVINKIVLEGGLFMLIAVDRNKYIKGELIEALEVCDVHKSSGSFVNITVQGETWNTMVLSDEHVQTLIRRSGVHFSFTEIFRKLYSTAALDMILSQLNGIKQNTAGIVERAEKFALSATKVFAKCEDDIIEEYGIWVPIEMREKMMYNLLETYMALGINQGTDVPVLDDASGNPAILGEIPIMADIDNYAIGQALYDKMFKEFEYFMYNKKKDLL